MIRLVATEQARGLGDAGEVHLKDLIRRTHLELVEHQMRDAVTLLASGGIALAEHVAKAIICGLDGIIVDIPLLLALECRPCRNCQRRPGRHLPHRDGQAPHRRGAQRLVNLVGAWNNQLLEILGAMGMREVRRLGAKSAGPCSRKTWIKRSLPLCSPVLKACPGGRANDAAAGVLSGGASVPVGGARGSPPAILKKKDTEAGL